MRKYAIRACTMEERRFFWLTPHPIGYRNGGREGCGDKVFGNHCGRRVVTSIESRNLHNAYHIGGCDLDKTYAGPKLLNEDGNYRITLDFIHEMIQWFKNGKTLPKRYVWEIALGAHRAFSSEESLVEVPVRDGVTIDVIGDVHGQCRNFENPHRLSNVSEISQGQFYDVLHLFRSRASRRRSITCS